MTGPQSHTRLVDTMFDAYVDWFEQCQTVRDAYRRWQGASADDGALTFAAYTAALDREECASHFYETLVARVAGRAARQAPRELVAAPDAGALRR
jgi:hypothetical protein